MCYVLSGHRHEMGRDNKCPAWHLLECLWCSSGGNRKLFTHVSEQFELFSSFGSLYNNMDTKPTPRYIPQITYTHFATYKVDYVSAHGVQPGTKCLVR